MGDEVSRRDLLRGLPGLFRKSARAFAASLGESVDKPKPGPPAKKFVLPVWGEPLEGIPAVHPFVVLAHATADRLGRRFPLSLLLGVSGEAFRLAYDRDDPQTALRRHTANGFLAALAVTGTAARASHGGPFAAALGSAEVAAGNGLVVVLGTSEGPAILGKVDRKTGSATVHRIGGARKLSFDRLEEIWSVGHPLNGPAPFLRIQVEKGSRPRPLQDFAKVSLESVRMLLEDRATEEGTFGLAVYDRIAGDLMSPDWPEDARKFVFGEFLESIGVGRGAAAGYLSSIARAIPPDEREPVEEAARAYGEIHRLSSSGGMWGTGLFPELAECLQTHGLPDLERAADPAVRDRAVELLGRIRDTERRAAAELAKVPPATAR